MHVSVSSTSRENESKCKHKQNISPSSIKVFDKNEKRKLTRLFQVLRVVMLAKLLSQDHCSQNWGVVVFCSR